MVETGGGKVRGTTYAAAASQQTFEFLHRECINTILKF